MALISYAYLAGYHLLVITGRECHLPAINETTLGTCLGWRDSEYDPKRSI